MRERCTVKERPEEQESRVEPGRLTIDEIVKLVTALTTLLILVLITVVTALRGQV
jgi:hypothetical protein